MRLLNVQQAPTNHRINQGEKEKVSTYEFWDEAVLDAVTEMTTQNLFSDTGHSYRELFEKEDFQSMGLKAFEEAQQFGDSQTIDRNTIAKLLVGKQKDYGPSNILDSPYGAEVGLKVRLWDKVARYENLTKTTNKETQYESLNDTVLDMLGYVCLGWMVETGAMSLPLPEEQGAPQ